MDLLIVNFDLTRPDRFADLFREADRKDLWVPYEPNKFMHMARNRGSCTLIRKADDELGSLDDTTDSFGESGVSEHAFILHHTVSPPLISAGWNVWSCSDSHQFHDAQTAALWVIQEFKKALQTVEPGDCL